MPASAYFLRSFERDEEAPSPAISLPFAQQQPSVPQPSPTLGRPDDHVQPIQAEHHVQRTAVRRPSTNGTSNNGASNRTPDSARQQFSRPASNGHSNGHDRKPASSSRPAKSATNGHPARRTSDARPGSTRMQSGTRSVSGARWNGAKNGKHNGNGAHAAPHSSNGATHSSNGTSHTKGSRSTGSASRVSNGNGSHRTGKPTGTTWSKRTGSAKGVKAIAKSSSPRKDARPAARKSRPTLAAAGRSGASGKRFFSSRTKQGTKKRG